MFSFELFLAHLWNNLLMNQFYGWKETQNMSWLKSMCDNYVTPLCLQNWQANVGGNEWQTPPLPSHPKGKLQQCTLYNNRILISFRKHIISDSNKSWVHTRKTFLKMNWIIECFLFGFHLNELTLQARWNMIRINL